MARKKKAFGLTLAIAAAVPWGGFTYHENTLQELNKSASIHWAPSLC